MIVDDGLINRILSAINTNHATFKRVHGFFLQKKSASVKGE
jgi:hypothetical protein